MRQQPGHRTLGGELLETKYLEGGAGSGEVLVVGRCWKWGGPVTYHLPGVETELVEVLGLRRCWHWGGVGTGDQYWETGRKRCQSDIMVSKCSLTVNLGRMFSLQLVL